MRFYRWLMGNSYADGEQAENEYHAQSGGQSAEENTVWSIADQAGYPDASEEATDFYIGWRAHEDNRRGFFAWLTGR